MHTRCPCMSVAVWVNDIAAIQQKCCMAFSFSMSYKQSASMRTTKTIGKKSRQHYPCIFPFPFVSVFPFSSVLNGARLSVCYLHVTMCWCIAATCSLELPFERFGNISSAMKCYFYCCKMLLLNYLCVELCRCACNSAVRHTIRSVKSACTLWNGISIENW